MACSACPAIEPNLSLQRAQQLDFVRSQGALQRPPCRFFLCTQDTHLYNLICGYTQFFISCYLIQFQTCVDSDFRYIKLSIVLSFVRHWSKSGGRWCSGELILDAKSHCGPLEGVRNQAPEICSWLLLATRRPQESLINLALPHLLRMRPCNSIRPSFSSSSIRRSIESTHAHTILYCK